jgi:Amt family ammonium transporter
LKLRRTYRILGAFRVLRSRGHRVIKEKAMRKVLLLALVTMFFATACNKSEETAPAPEAAASSAASEAASAAAAPSAAEAASPAAAPSAAP